MAPNLEEKKRPAEEKKSEEAKSVAKKSNAPGQINNVVVHPLVLLSVVDHYNRVARGTRKRVVGVLLGDIHKGKVDITNSYAVPFEEDSKSPNVWFLDHTYHEEMFIMFKKVNAKERVVGWYSTGSKTKPADIAINELMRRYTANPVYCLIDVNPQDDLEIPVKSFFSKSQDGAAVAHNANKSFSKTFERLPVEVGAFEAEEVGVEHLLRDIRDTTESTLADQVQAKLNSLTSLKNRMEEIHRYLCNVTANRLPVNHEIIYNIQDIFNLIPNLNLEQVVKSFSVNTNDNFLVVYLASLIRSILALHDLIKNKVMNGEHERKQRLKEQGLLDEDGNEIKAESKSAAAATAENDDAEKGDSENTDGDDANNSGANTDASQQESKKNTNR